MKILEFLGVFFIAIGLVKGIWALVSYFKSNKDY
jgi:hypothetical protein